MENKSSTCHMTNEKRLIWDEDAKQHLIALAVGHHSETLHIDMILNAILHHTTTVDAVEVVHGEWLDGYAVDHNGKKVYDSIDCSVCAGIFKIENHSREYWKEKFMFCPFCGSLMDGGNEDD